MSSFERPGFPISKERPKFPMSRISALNLTSELLDILDGCMATTQDIKKRRQDRIQDEKSKGQPIDVEESAVFSVQNFDAEYGAKTMVKDQVRFIDQIARDLLHERPRRGMELSPTAQKIQEVLSGKPELERARDLLLDLQKRLQVPS